SCNAAITPPSMNSIPSAHKPPGRRGVGGTKSAVSHLKDFNWKKIDMDTPAEFRKHAANCETMAKLKLRLYGNEWRPVSGNWVPSRCQFHRAFTMQPHARSARIEGSLRGKKPQIPTFHLPSSVKAIGPTPSTSLYLCINLAPFSKHR